MKREHANELAAKFKGLMPRMTEEQLRLVRDELLAVEDVAAAGKRVVAYCSSRADFDLMSALHAIRARCDFAKQTQNRLAEYRECEEAIHAQNMKEDAAIGALREEERNRLAERVLLLLPERIANVERKRPQLSRLVKGLMYKDLLAEQSSNDSEPA